MSERIYMIQEVQSLRATCYELRLKNLQLMRTNVELRKEIVKLMNKKQV